MGSCYVFPFEYAPIAVGTAQWKPEELYLYLLYNSINRARQLFPHEQDASCGLTCSLSETSISILRLDFNKESVLMVTKTRW